MLYGNPDLSGQERFLDKDEIIVTKTDLAGKITYANRTFYEIAGYKENECIGQQHNIIRHPHMPRAVFELLWQVIASGDEIFAYVNNRAKNGDNYWVFAHITPSFDDEGKIIAYHSNRRAPNREVINNHIVPLYKTLLDVELAESSPKAGLQNSFAAVEDLLREKKMNFNQFMFSLGV